MSSRWLLHISLAATAALAPGCALRSAGRAAPGATAAPDAAVAAPPPAAGETGQPQMIGAMMSGLLAQARRPGPYDEPLGSTGAAADKPHHAVVELSGRVVELGGFALLGGGPRLVLRELVEHLRALDRSPQVRSTLLRVDELALSLPAAEELRDALGGLAKPVHCHAARAAENVYHLLTGCDSLTIAPAGEVWFPGPLYTGVYLQGLLSRLGVQADFLYVGAYKGAAEPLLRSAPSAEMRETLQALVDGAYARRVQALVQGRRLDEARAGAAVERGLFVGRAAVQAGLVDEVALAEEWLAARAGAEPWLVRPVVDEPGGVGDLLTLLGIVPPARPRGPHVALLYAVGPVVEGGQRGQLGAYEQISGRRLAAALRQAAAEEAVRAIVLRIDSPGGSALASEMIWHAVREARSRKPVVVSMAQVAGSGGYYIACAASRIWAQPDTLTGSIGVVGGKLVVGRGLGRIGIALHEVGRGASAGLYSVARAWSGSERALMRTMMEEVYATFKQRVAEGRKLSPERVEEVARGRLWTGAAARERGLVDELGGLAAALADARQLAGLPADAAVDVYPGRPTLVDLMRQLGATAVPGPGAALLADTGVGGPVLHWIGGQLAAVLRFATEPVQTVAFPPVLASRALADPVQR